MNCIFTSVGRSPLFGHFSTTLLGLDTIRAFGAQETFKDQFISYQDIHSRAWFAYISGQAWLTFRLQILCVLFLTFVAVISPVLKDSKFHEPFCRSIFCFSVIIPLYCYLRNTNAANSIFICFS